MWAIVKTGLIYMSNIPVAGGTVGFTLLLGGTFGRFFGEMVYKYFGISHIAKFAVAGAAAVAIGIC